MRVALTGLTIAEYFRDVEGQDVLLFINNIFRFTQAVVRFLPFLVVCHQPLVTNLHLLLKSVIAKNFPSTKKGSVTSIQAIYVPADD